MSISGASHSMTTSGNVPQPSQVTKISNLLKNISYHAKRGSLIAAKTIQRGAGIGVGAGVASGLPAFIGAATSSRLSLGLSTALGAASSLLSVPAGCGLGYVAGLAGAAVATPIGAIAGAAYGVIDSIFNKPSNNIYGLSKKVKNILTNSTINNVRSPEQLDTIAKNISDIILKNKDKDKRTDALNTYLAREKIEGVCSEDVKKEVINIDINDKDTKEEINSINFNDRDTKNNRINNELNTKHQEINKNIEDFFKTLKPKNFFDKIKNIKFQ